MRTSLIVSIALTLFPLLINSVGVPDGDGFPSLDERIQLELANRARVDPQIEMDECGSNCADAACYSVMPPLYYNHALGRSARFHAAHMATNGYFAHPSACTLDSDLPDTWPDR